MNAALKHYEGDRVPVSDFFWSSFVERWRRELGLPEDAEPYAFYDLDWMVTTPNLDPHIRDFEVLHETEEEVVVRTGFGATIRKKYRCPMPEYVAFDTDSIEELRTFHFDDPWDDRRYFKGGDNQIAGVGDSFVRNLPPWTETVKLLNRDFAVYGSVAEGYEMLWRVVGSENALAWIGLYPDEVGRFTERINEFAVEVTKAQMMAAGGLLDGMVIWGDVAYTRGMFFSPRYWRKHFKPGVAEIIKMCHDSGLPVIYHGCGQATPILEDLIEIGLDAYNPLEAKAGLDVVDLRRKLGHRLAFCGNMDVISWASDSKEELKQAVLTKLNAAKGGGYIFQSDHSVPGNVSGESYDYVVKLVRQYGTYPLRLGGFDIPGI
jgi:hypothetical protein